MYTQSNTTNTLQGIDYMLLSTFAEDAESISGPNISISVKSMMSIYNCMFSILCRFLEISAKFL